MDGRREDMAWQESERRRGVRTRQDDDPVPVAYDGVLIMRVPDSSFSIAIMRIEFTTYLSYTSPKRPHFVASSKSSSRDSFVHLKMRTDRMALRENSSQSRASLTSSL